MDSRSLGGHVPTRIARAGWSKRPDVSPAQPWHAKTRHSAGKAPSERRGEAHVPLYVEPLSDARTMLEDFFNILLDQVDARCA